MTTFTCKLGTLSLEVMPFGLMNAAETCKRMITNALKRLSLVTVYIDDVVIFSESQKSHLDQIMVVMEGISRLHLKIKLIKWYFAQSFIKLLAHVVYLSNIKVDSEKISRIKNAPRPTSETEMRSFLGLASYYRRFLQDVAEIAASLYKLTSKTRKFGWGPEMENNFAELKRKLCEQPVLTYPGFEKHSSSKLTLQSTQSARYCPTEMQKANYTLYSLRVVQ